MQDNDVASRVKSAIERAGKTTHGIAAETGITRSTLERRLKAAGSFSVAELSRISSAVGIPVHALLGPL